MTDTPGAPVRIGRVIVKPSGEREVLSPLVDAADADMAGATVVRGPYGEPIVIPVSDDPEETE